MSTVNWNICSFIKNPDSVTCLKLFLYTNLFMKSSLLTICLLIFSCCLLQAQQATVTTGGKATGANGSTTYSIGELIIPSSSGSGGSLGSGLQIPFEISLVTALPNTELIISASVFPNPTRNSVRLKIGDPFLKSYQFFLYDAQGNLLKTGQVRNGITEIDLINYPKGIFLLTIKNKGRQTTSFKIVKAN